MRRHRVLIAIWGFVAFVGATGTGIARAEDPTAIYNVLDNTIEYPRGNRVGSVIGGIAVDLKGQPFSQSVIGINRLRRTDGQLYSVAKDGTIAQVKETTDEARKVDRAGSSLDVTWPGTKKVSKSNINQVLAIGDPPGGGLGNGGGNVGGGNSTPPATKTQLNNKVPWDNVPSQQSTNAGNPNAELPRAASDQNKTGQGNLEYVSYIDMLNDWSALYGGVTKSPTVIDARKRNLEYPNLLAISKESQRPKLGNVYKSTEEMGKPKENEDIGVDDQVLKTSMAVYQPIFRLQKDFLEDEFKRDNYLNTALTIRGIAVMTMGFLDKTVGAGLTAVQQQADQNTIQFLLKQIAWTTSKLANPDRAQVYRDTDEKLEACLEMAIKEGKAPDEVKAEKTSRKWVEYKDCDKRCGGKSGEQNYIPEGKQVTAESMKKSGGGHADKCVCCAETDEELNKITKDGKLSDTGQYKEQAQNMAEDKEWSLAERTFIGTVIPNSGGDGGISGGNEDDKVKGIVFFFKEMYGDVLIRKQTTVGEPFFQYVYLFPKWSVQRKVLALRNGCITDETGGQDVGQESKDCPMEELAIKEGICPSITKIIKNWDKIKKGEMQDDDLANWWTEASMGYPLSGEVVEAFFSINGNPTAQITDIKGKLKRVIDNYCDASSVAAFTRYHSRLAAIVQDHLALNQHVTTADKSKLLSLVNRVSEQLQLAQADVAASYPTEAIYTGALQAKDRKAAGYTSAQAEATQDTQRRASYTGGLTSYGGPTYLAIGGGGGAGGGGATPRTAPEGGLSDKITAALGKLK